MRKYALRIASVVYVTLLALAVWRADVKFGPERAGTLAFVGIFLLIVLARVAAYIIGIVWGPSRYYSGFR